MIGITRRSSMKLSRSSQASSSSADRCIREVVLPVLKGLFFYARERTTFPRRCGIVADLPGARNEFSSAKAGAPGRHGSPARPRLSARAGSFENRARDVHVQAAEVMAF